MKAFPKKYKPQDLYNRAKQFRKKYDDFNKETETNDYIFSPGIFSISKKIAYYDFFPIYLRDFFDYRNNLQNSTKDGGDNSPTQQLFIPSNDYLSDICFEYKFFNKKNQNLNQVGTVKLKKHMISTSKKNLKTNNKFIESFLSSPHKIYIPDSNLYIYTLKQIHSLRENGKLKNETKIGYRSFNLQTSIPLQNITRKKEKRPYYVLKYFVGAKCEALPVYVNDIDLCCGDVALLVHPKDKRYNKFIGKNAIIPLCNRQIPIIGDENVNIAINYGIKRVCPCADEESIQLAQKYDLPTDIYVFDQQGLYTEFIHEPAFIGQERNKYYSNIEGFIKDIGNLSETGEQTVNVPYLDYINERLTPYKIDQFIIDSKQEKQKVLEKIFSQNLNFSFLNNEFGDTINEINNIQNEINNIHQNNENLALDNDDNQLEELQNLENQAKQLKQKIADKLEDYLPNYFIINNQLKHNRKIPFLKNSDGTFSFFDIEKDCLTWKNKPLQNCFDFVTLCFVRIGILGIKDSLPKICEYDKLPIIFSENEKKIEYCIEHLTKITGKNSEYNKFLEIIQNLSNESSNEKNDLKKLIDNSKFIKKDGNYLILDIKGGLANDSIDGDFVQLNIPCFLKDKDFKINDTIIYSKEERSKIFQKILLQEVLLGEIISHNYIEYSYNKDIEFLGDKQLTKLQMEQSQRNSFSLFGENPIRLNLLINQTYDQKEILLNNIFLKQIWNATRLCIQKDFLPNDIEECLNKQPKDFEDFDIVVLDKLKELHNNREIVKTYKDYIEFFNYFKESIQNIFFSRYLEIQKVHPTKDVQFVSAYFFNFLLTILYPLIPEFVDALQYISEKKFIQPIKPLEINKTTNYNMNILYNIFIKIKQIKIGCNIKQHESCNLFIKSIPAIGDIFAENEQIFKNYFHISEISYLRLHETNPLGFEISCDDTITIGIQHGNSDIMKEKDSLENIEKEIKNLDDRLSLLRQRIQILPEGEDRKKAEEEYAKTKEEMENLTIKHSLLSSK